MSDIPAANEVVDAILARRSVRFGYELRPVDEATIRTIVACGVSAPSSKNARPWRLHVVRERATLDAIASAAETATGIDEFVPHDPLTGRPYAAWQSTVRESAAVLREVPCAVAIENRGVFSRGIATLASIPPQALASSLMAFGLENIGLGAAIENMWLAANSLGVSVAFLGDLAIADPAARELLALEGELVGVLAMGHATGTLPPRREPPASTQTADPVVWH